MKSLCLILALCACLTATCAVGATAGFPVVQSGQAKCQIVLGKDALAVEKQAASDLARCLKLMTSVEVPLVDEGKEKAGLPKIMVGPCALPVDVMKRVNDRDYGGYIITQVGPDLILRGPSEFGSANAVYGLLEDTLGCHWFMPSELFEYVPKRAEVVLPALNVATNPGFRFRYFSGVTEGGPWQFRNRLDQPGNPNAPFLAQGHILYALYPPSQYGKDHPEYYAQLGGQRRVPPDNADQSQNPCTSNPEVIQIAVDKINKFFDARPKASTHSLCINDTNTWCQCDACKALDVPLPVWRGREIYSDRYYTYANAVARGVAAKHPNQFLGVFAYWGVEPTPVKIPRLEPNVYVGITQDCAQHFDPAYRQTDYDFITQWQKKAAHVGKYDYFGLGAVVPRYYPHLIAQDIKHSKAVGLEGYAEDLAAMRKHLRQAAQLADTDLEKQRVAYVQKGTEYGLNLIEGWLAAEKLATMMIIPETAEETARLIKQVNRCVELSPRLWQSSIIDDPLAIGWYKAGARGNVIAQWSSHCQDGVIQATMALGNCLDSSDQKLAGLLSRLQGTDAETIMRVSRGEFDNAPNLLPNGSFESTEGTKDKPTGPGWTSEGTPPGWGSWKIDASRGKFYLDAGNAHAGKMSGAIEGGDCLCYITTVPVEAGKRYAASAWAMAEKVSPTRKTTLEVRWQDAKGAWFGGGLNTATAIRKPGQWERLVSAVKAPEGAAKAVILLVADKIPEGERAWFDDVTFVLAE